MEKKRQKTQAFNRFKELADRKKEKRTIKDPILRKRRSGNGEEKVRGDLALGKAAVNAGDEKKKHRKEQAQEWTETAPHAARRAVQNIKAKS